MEKFLTFLGGVALIVIMSLLLAWPVMLLWNWLMPLIFGIMSLSFWQALGISLLCGLLFKSSSN